MECGRIPRRLNSLTTPQGDINNGRSNAKVVASKRLRCRTIRKEVSWFLQLMTAGAARRIFSFYPA